MQRRIALNDWNKCLWVIYLHANFRTMSLSFSLTHTHTMALCCLHSKDLQSTPVPRLNNLMPLFFSHFTLVVLTFTWMCHIPLQCRSIEIIKNARNMSEYTMANGRQQKGATCILILKNTLHVYHISVWHRLLHCNS